MFERWADWRTLRTFTPPRPVIIDTTRVLPVTVGALGINRHPTLHTRANAVRIEPAMPGLQLAWAQLCDGQWLGIVYVEIHSANRLSTLDMHLWCPPTAITLASPESLSTDRP